MKTEFDKTTTNFGCYAENGNEQDNHLSSESFTISDVLNARVSLKDKAWFIRKNCELSDTELRELAIGCALVVLPIYEEKYPDNKAPREAIEAAKAYLKNEISLDELIVKRRAAYHAAAAADAYDAADAAYAAAYAAYAAYHAAYHAADAAAAAAAYAAAADDAAYAAAADDAAADGSTYQEQLLQFFKDFLSK